MISSFVNRSPETCCPPARWSKRTSSWWRPGSWALGVKDVNQRFKVRFIMDNVDEQIDTVVVAPCWE